MSWSNQKCWSYCAPSVESDSECIEHQLIQAYSQLTVTPPNGDGYRVVAVGRFGDVEVHLAELPLKRALSSIPPLWIEIFSCTDRGTIDGYGCLELGKDELAAAVEMILKARQCSRYHS